MPKVSQNPISRETEQQIFAALIQTLARLDKPDILQVVLDDLLTPT